MAEHKSVGILGAGVVGLASALLLSESGISVTVVARDLPGDQTLQWSSPWKVCTESLGQQLTVQGWSHPVTSYRR
jgi:glycine/D-amino acid oxidase-like deaminating enzyme